MTPIQGAIWNVLSDEWQAPQDIRAKCRYEFNQSSLKSLVRNYGVETRTITPRHQLYRLPQPKETSNDE
jgi:hypothetical protein